MHVTVEIPDILARQMHLDGPEAQRRALVTLAVESYRAGDLSRGQIGELLDFSVDETEQLLKEHGCELEQTFEQFERESEQLKAYLER